MRLLILSASAGAGHLRAAQALEEAAKEILPSAEIQNCDILDFTSALYKKTYAGSYLHMIDQAPALWGMLYRATDQKALGSIQAKLSRFHDKFEFARFRRFVREFQPDQILATHFLPGQIFAHYRRKGRDRFPLSVVITDFDAHRFWVESTVDRYFVGNEETAAVLADRGINAEKIQVSGIPISAAFSQNFDTAKIRQAFGFAANIPTVLIMSGGAGVGSMEDTVKICMESSPVQILAVAGKNEKLRKSLETLLVPTKVKLRVFGFVNQIAELMSISDFAISKSGGLTSAECLAMGLPMIVREPVPGQEERNCDFLVESGAALKTQGLGSLRYKLQLLLRQKERLAKMRKAAAAQGRANAAKEIVRTISH